jgi:hypothetical protein
MSDLDPRWQWVEERRFCDPNPTYVRVACSHLEVVPVETTAGGLMETVAHLCLTCDSQLPAEWRTPAEQFPPPTTAELHLGIDYDDPIDEYRHHQGARP